MESMESMESTIDELKKVFEDYKEHGDATKLEEDILQKDSVTKLEFILNKINQDSPDYVRIMLMKCSLLYEKAKICLYRNDYLNSKLHLEKALTDVRNFEDHPQVAYLYMKIVNYLSYVLSKLSLLEPARNLLEDLLNRDLDYDADTYCTGDLFYTTSPDQTSAKNKLKKIFINNMKMLSWIYGKMGLIEQYAMIMHRSLDAELDLVNLDKLQWAIKCSRLASLFIIECKWENARYHLAAAGAVMDSLDVNEGPSPNLIKAQADFARIWVNYGLQLFSFSRGPMLEKLWESNEIPTPETEFYVFSSFEFELPEVPTTEVITIDDARILFNHTFTWLKRARFFYTLRDYPLYYVNIILELGELYKYMSYYETTIDEQYAVQKKRYETLESLSCLLREMKPNCYVAMSLEITKEIIDVQIEMMNLNLKKIYNPMKKCTFKEPELKRRMETVADICIKLENVIQEDDEEDIEEEVGVKSDVEPILEQSNILTEITSVLDEITRKVVEESSKKTRVLSLGNGATVSGENEGGIDEKNLKNIFDASGRSWQRTGDGKAV